MELIDQLQKHLYKYDYYTRRSLASLIPSSYWRQHLKDHLHQFANLTPPQQQVVLERVNYYNKLNQPFAFPRPLNFDDQLYQGKKSAAYMLDFKGLIRYFPDEVNFSYWFGDITRVPDFPTFLKSRPIDHSTANANSVLLKLNKIRHYYVVKDRLAFAQKIPRLVWRGKSNQPDRVAMLKRFYESSLCDVGDTHYPDRRTIYQRPFLSIPQQLQYRYVLSIEGNDVATNLKWIMASNSVCFMRKPRYETWFMEGRLIPDVHYVLLKDDHSDMEEKVRFYNDHPELAMAIVRNANAWVKQFFDESSERLISLMVMQKYFQLSQPASH